MKVECAYCGKKFDKPLQHVKQAAKNGWQNICSKDCSVRNARTYQGIGKTKVMLQCSGCGEAFQMRHSHWKYGLKRGQKNFFCSQSCVAKSWHGKRYEGKKIEPRVIENRKRQK